MLPEIASRRIPTTFATPPKIKARLTDLGSTIIGGSPADFGKFIAEETEKWAKVVKFSGVKA
jgi:hypothetical protein